jgi:hypothetical protein
MTRGPASKDDLSNRCTATLHFPAEPYHNLRCSQKPHDQRNLHSVTTTVPTARPDGSKPVMADVVLTWADQPTT